MQLNMKQSYCYHPKADYFPINLCPEVFHFSYSTIICRDCTFFLIIVTFGDVKHQRNSYHL